MKKAILGIILFSSFQAWAFTQNDCLNGNFKACREIFNKYGSQTDRAGAVELFEKACSAQTLRVSCEISSFSKTETLEKILKTVKRDSGAFVMNGSQIDKFYQISELK